jgi:peptide chain release factor subunit 3
MIDKKSGKKSKHPPKFLKQGDSAIVRLETAQPICLETYGEYQQLGRFTLRDEGMNSITLFRVFFLTVYVQGKLWR